GNGKTAIAESMGKMILGDAMYIPYAVEVAGHVIRVFDNVNHVLAEGQSEKNADPRWARIQRPVIITGGELTLETLDLVYDPNNKYYEAPFQMKANGGMLLIDDFGRQQVRPRDLLNRWIVPLEKRVDYLTLHTGKKFRVPFDTIVVFATNIEPYKLADEAFLRRIRNKIYVEDPTLENYLEIFKRYCEKKAISFDPSAIDYLYQEYYLKYRISLRSCHPRDLIEQIVSIAKFNEIPPSLDRELLDRACRIYFLLKEPEPEPELAGSF
ncbi:MAG: ATP-binding protein, partial [candidate division WOR-3 bacterium]